MLKEGNQRIENPISDQLPSVRIRVTFNSTNRSASIKNTIIIVITIITTTPSTYIYIYIMKAGKETIHVRERDLQGMAQREERPAST